ncbi:MAG TPA: ABC transporter permease [Phaeodactylibacter sp.]|nr:ABC transporter permease [Phaeodactylibacter sp.]
MKTLIKIAWRNVWRNKLRSSLVIMSIVFGIWAGLFLMAMTLGLNEQRMSGAVDTYLSHVQIHHPKFKEDQNLKYFIQDKKEILDAIHANKNIEAYAERIIASGMITNAKGSKGIQLLGIHPEEEKKLTTISTLLTEGTYFTKFKKYPAVIGQKLAKKLNLKIRSKIVVTLQDFEGNLTSALFRVEGIFKTNSSIFDEGTLFVRASDLDKSIGMQGRIHEIAILGNSIDKVKKIKTDLASKIKTSKVETWNEISPELGYAQEMMGSMIYIFMGIVLIALAFSIINTMLMAVLERKKELGMLMAVGLNKKRLFAMISLETLFIAIVATPIGMLLSYWSIEYFRKYGIDLSVVAAGLESLGIGNRIYTYLPANLYISITAMTLVVAFLASIFPARRALKLRPAEAIRSA